MTRTCVVHCRYVNLLMEMYIHAKMQNLANLTTSTLAPAFCS